MPMKRRVISNLRRKKDATVDKYTIDFPDNLPNGSHRHSANPPVVHRLTISGEHYTFIAVGDEPWVQPGDTISFEYRTKDRYRNIRVGSIQVKDANGQPVIRGFRRSGKAEPLN